MTAAISFLMVWWAAQPKAAGSVPIALYLAKFNRLPFR